MWLSEQLARMLRIVPLHMEADIRSCVVDFPGDGGEEEKLHAIYRPEADDQVARVDIWVQGEVLTARAPGLEDETRMMDEKILGRNGQGVIQLAIVRDWEDTEICLKRQGFPEDVRCGSLHRWEEGVLCVTEQTNQDYLNFCIGDQVILQLQDPKGSSWYTKSSRDGWILEAYRWMLPWLVTYPLISRLWP